MDCLDDRTVLAFLAGRGAGDVDAIDAHLAGCPACCDLVVLAARRSFAAGTPAVAETERATPAARRADGDEPPPGERYTIEGLLGAGGQALVYAAHDTVLGRRVALKLLRDTRDAGVLDEARVAAQLNHPNIVAVHDAGRLPDGQLYLAMEHVDGGSLDRWLARGRRRRTEILRVLVEAGRGLAAAHDAGIVHRDIKAANILVGEDGRARVTDFGLATLGDRAVVAGTLVYMAPEQLDGEATAASDQFGFAATAWEALTGALPFAPIADRAAAIERGIVAPRRPLPRWLDRALRRALAVEPSRRWPSMRALVDALAADPTRRWKRVGIGAMAMVTAGAMGLAIAARDAGPSCTSLPSAALAPSRRAEIEAAFAASKKPFAAAVRSRVVAALDAYAAALDAQRAEACRATGAGTQSAELLDLRDQCLDERTRALGAAADVLAHAGDAEIENAISIAGGLPALASCADRTWLLERVRPPADAATRARVDQVGTQIAASTAQLRAGAIPAAIETADAAVAAALELEHLPTRARAELAAGQARAKLGETQRAEQHLQEAAQLAQRGRDDLTAGEAWIELVKVIGHGNARYDEALRYAGFADATAARLGSATGLRARLAYHKCAIFDLQAKLEDAGRACDEAIALWTGERGANAPEISDVLVIAARVAYKRAQPEVARETIARALAIREAALGAEHPAIMEALFVTAQVALGTGRLPDARAALDRALQIGRAALGDDALPVASVYSQSAALRHRTGDLTGALADIDRSTAVRERTNGLEHPDLVFNLVTRARILEDLKRDPEAAVAYERARAIAERSLGDKHPSLSAILQDLGRLHGRLGDTALARRELDRALAVAKAGEEPTAIAGATTALAELLHAGGEPAAAIPHYKAALAAYEALLGPEHPQLIATLQNLGIAYTETRAPREALAVLGRGLALETAASGEQAAALFGLLEPLGDAQLALGDRATARATWTRAVALEGVDAAQAAAVRAKLRRLQ